MAYPEFFSSVGILLVLAGVVIIVIAVFLLSVRGRGQRQSPRRRRRNNWSYPDNLRDGQEIFEDRFVAVSCAHGSAHSHHDRLLFVAEVKRTTEEETGNEDEGNNVPGKLLLLLVLGFAIVVVGIIIIAIGAVVGGGSASVGGVIFIGPFPIVFGVGPDAAWLIAISIVLAVVSVMLFVLFRRRS